MVYLNRHRLPRAILFWPLEDTVISPSTLRTGEFLVNVYTIPFTGPYLSFPAASSLCRQAPGDLECPPGNKTFIRGSASWAAVRLASRIENVGHLLRQVLSLCERFRYIV